MSIGFTYDQVQNQFPTIAAGNVRFVTLLPGNVLKGPVTLERIRGSVHVMFNDVNLGDTFGEFHLSLQISLVPLRNAAIEPLSILDPENSADLESNRILWRRSYVPSNGAAIPGPLASSLRWSPSSGDIDVKSKRRFDRATWALIMTAKGISPTTTFVSMDLRGLFKTSEGI